MPRLKVTGGPSVAVQGLRSRRKMLGLLQSDVARLLFVHVGTIRAWEKGATPSPESWVRWHGVLGVPVGDAEMYAPASARNKETGT